ncbi:MAG: TRAP transporter small permease subunit [bacterium]
MKILKLINYNLYRLIKIAVVLLFMILLILSAAQIVLRLIFHSGISNAEGMMRYLVLWVAFLGACLASYKGRHISLDVVSKALKKLNKNLIVFLISTVSFVILSFLFKASVDFIISEISGSQSIFFVPIWVLETVIPFTFFFMALVYLQSIIVSAKGMIKGIKK